MSEQRLIELWERRARELRMRSQNKVERGMSYAYDICAAELAELVAAESTAVGAAR